MAIVKLLAAALVASAVHAVVLRIATNLMVHVAVIYGRAYKIVVVEYLAGAAVLGILLLTGITDQIAAYIVAGAVLLFVGAFCIGKWLSFDDGDRVGVGNGILIQFVQIPLVLPFAILASFLIDATK